jgi:hypothetical protein
MRNAFAIGIKYSASQKISRRALSEGHAPLFYQELTYLGFDVKTKEHQFDFEGETKWFDDDCINNGKSEDNSMVFGRLTDES